jgi:hypothetical protein
MSLGQITAQLAQEALGRQLDDLTGSAPASPAATTPAGAVLAQIQAMQNALKEDQELTVTCQAARDLIRVVEIFAPAPGLLVITGFDSERALTRVVTAVEAVQLICKPGTIKPGAKAARIRLVAAPNKQAS